MLSRKIKYLGSLVVFSSLFFVSNSNSVQGHEDCYGRGWSRVCKPHIHRIPPERVNRRSIVSTRTFNHPTIGNYYLDYCREAGRNCGQPSADKFCQDKGYRRARSFNWTTGGANTISPGSYTVCNNATDKCGRIYRVTCSR